MPSKANDKTNDRQRGTNPPPHADGGTVSRLSTAATTDGGTPSALLVDKLLALLHNLPPEELARVLAEVAAATNVSSVEEDAGDDTGRLAPGLPRNGNSEHVNLGHNLFSVPSNLNRNENDAAGGILGENLPPLATDGTVSRPSTAATADGGMLRTPNALLADELLALLHSLPPEELARVLAGVAATMNAPIVEEGAGDEARRLAPGLLRNGNSELANPGRNLFSVPSNSNRNENDLAGGILDENLPPLATEAFVLAGVGPPPAAVDIAMRPASLAGSPYSGDSLTSPVKDDAIFAEGGGDNELGHNHDRNQLLENRGVELIDDNEDLPLSNAMIESSVPDTLKSVRQQDSENGNKIELIEDIDVDGPPRPPAMLAGSPDNVDICSKKAAKGIQFATADEELSPRPFDAAEFEDGDAIKKKRQHVPQNPMRSDEDSSSIPTNEEMNVEVELNAVDGTVEATSPPAVIGTNADTANPDAHRTEDEEEDTAQVNNPEDTIMDAIVDLETGSPYEVPLATWITDDVIDATRLDPIEPPLRWFKQKQANFFFVLVGVVLAVVIVSSVLLPSNNENAVTIVVTSSNAPSVSSIPSPHPTLVSSNIPSITTFPSIDPTEPPSVSALPTTSPSNEHTSVPSSPPSACVAKVSSSVQKIDLPVEDPYLPKVAVDGRNMVVAVQDGFCGPVTVIFYSLANDGWQRDDTFPYDDDMGSWPSVAISGKTALVGFYEANDGAGAVLVYKQNQFGDWEEVEDSFIQDVNASGDRFGYRVGIHRNLAYVSDYVDHVYIFRRESDKWVEIDRIDLYARASSILGDVIAIASGSSTLGNVLHLYKYMPDLDGVVSIQDPISTGWVFSMDLSNNYLVYWDYNERDAFIYRREATNQTFVFHQRLNISGPEINFGLALDNDILVVRGDSNTHIFSEENGNWVETITLDQGYEHFALSGRQLLATTYNHEVYSYNIQDCAQEMPTQIPSASPTSTLSMIPSTSSEPSSSFYPSMSQSPSLVPTSSLSPTNTCYWITIAIVHDDWPQDTSWELWRVADDDGEDELFKSHQGSRGDVSHSQPICLPEGEWKFVISDSAGDGICCGYAGEGHYNVTSNGALIAEGGEFDWEESTTFLIPFVPAP